MKRNLPYIVAWIAQGVLGFFSRWLWVFFSPQFSQNFFDTIIPSAGKIATYALILLAYGVLSFLIFKFVVDQIVIPNVRKTENPSDPS